MWHQIHIFLHDLRWLILVVALGMMAYAGVLLMRAFRELQEQRSRPPATLGRRTRVAQPSTEALTRSKTSPAMAAASEADDRGRSFAGNDPAPVAAAQQDLLSQLPDDAYVPASGVPAPTLEAGDEAHQPTRRLSDDRLSSYGIDAKARTRMDLARDQVPGLGPVAIGERPAQDPAERERRATEVMPAGEAPPSVGAPVESPASAVAVRGTATDEDLLRRATRMEELGFHVGIVTERLRENPAQVSEDEKRRLHATLGALEQSAPVAGETASAGSRADRDRKDLADVLSKLDRALEEAFGPDVEVVTPESTSPEAATQPVPPEPATTLVQAAQAQPDTERSEAHPAVTATDKMKATERKVARGAKKNTRLPDWARSDSFDEDQDGDAGKGTQLDIFKPG